MDTEDLKRGRYTFVKRAFERGKEARYCIFGIHGSWRESNLKELVIAGHMVLLPEPRKGIALPKAS